jgi:hypothetical protein
VLVVPTKAHAGSKDKVPYRLCLPADVQIDRRGARKDQCSNTGFPLDADSMKVADLRSELSKRNLQTTGLKKELAMRLRGALSGFQIFIRLL